MRLFCYAFAILVIFVNLVSLAFSAEEVKTIYVSAAVSNKAVEIQEMFEELLPPKTPVVYTLVPRGLIVSVREDVFFKGESVDINLSGVEVLDAIVGVLRKIDNDCTIEGHTEGHVGKYRIYQADWEISMARANSIADYLVYCGQIPSERVFPLGFGDFMPFRDNVSSKQEGFDKRVDFVIFDYEYKR